MRITTWNTRSLGTRQGGIEATKKRFINNASNDQDLIILTETRHLEREPFKIKWTKGRETILQTPARKPNQSIEDAITDGREEEPHIPNANQIQRYPPPLNGERGRGGGGDSGPWKEKRNDSVKQFWNLRGAWDYCSHPTVKDYEVLPHCYLCSSWT